MNRLNIANVLTMLFGLFIVCVCCFLCIAIYLRETAPIVKFKEERIDNIVRVFLHNPGEYSGLVLQDKTLETVEFNHITRCKGEVKLVMDVDENKSIYAIVEYYNKNEILYLTKTAIHIHYPEEIESGGWYNSVRKRITTGQTNVIE